MIKLVVGVLLGACVTYVLMNGTGDLAQKARGAVHNVAAEVAGATEPKAKDTIGDFIDRMTK